VTPPPVGADDLLSVRCAVLWSWTITEDTVGRVRLAHIVQGWKTKAIARELKLARNTVRATGRCGSGWSAVGRCRIRVSAPCAGPEATTGSDAGGANRANVASLFKACTLNALEPHNRLADTPPKLVNGWPWSKVDDLAPWASAKCPSSPVNVRTAQR
jgi:hypothetical protein